MRSLGLRTVARRLSWGLADQAVSSLTNFAVGIYVARTLGLIAFGIFSIALVTYALVLNMSRGVATDPLMVRFSGVATDAWRDAVAQSSGIALRIGALAGVVCALTGIVVGALGLGGQLGATYLALGLVLPALMLQDSWRFAFFAAGQGRKAFLNDVVWGVALVPLLFFAAQRGSLVGSVLAWGLSAAVAAGYGCIQSGVLPRMWEGRGWLREHRDLNLRYLVENVCLSGATQVRMYGVGAIAGLAAVGTIRGAELLLGPFMAVVMGLSLVSVAEASRTLRHSPHRLRLFCLLVGGGQAAAALIWGLALLLLLSDEVGEFVLGQVWLPASALILPVTLWVVGVSLATGASAGLRALGAARRSLRAQLFASSVFITAGLVGAAMAGALGSAWGVAAASLSGSVVWWYQLHAGLRDHKTSPPAGPHPVAVVPASQTANGGVMTRSDVPRLSIGLPVYNGEEYLAESLDALLGQSFEDFELIISDNASTDGTEDICRRYRSEDSRIRYIRLPRNVGAAPNHNYVATLARGELWKWASHDDLYGRDLLLRCIEALDERPEVVLAHAGTAVIDGSGYIKQPFDYRLATDSPHAPLRFRSLLFEPGGDDFYGVMRADVLRRVVPHDSYHHAERTFVAEIALHGPFYQVPELLYFRRDHPTRAERANPTVRSRCANLDPRRARHPTVLLLGEYVWGFAAAIRRAPLTSSQRRECYRYLGQWLMSRTRLGAGERIEDRPPIPNGHRQSVDQIVARRG